MNYMFALQNYDENGGTMFWNSGIYTQRIESGQEKQ